MGSNNQIGKAPTTTGGMRPSMTGGGRSTSGGQWTGDKQQLKFRSEVLKAAIADRLKKGRRRYTSLDNKDLAVVKSSKGVKVNAKVAEKAAVFLSAAKDALKRAHKTAQEKISKNVDLTSLEEDALVTEDIKISGYRSIEKEKIIWNKKFRDYYNRTIKGRSQTGDPHGANAKKLMVNFITDKKAPPGFSKHTLGVSIDFYQIRYSSLHDILAVNKKARLVNNSTKKGKAPGRNEWWYQTWLYKWLHQYAKQYGFKKLPSEAWHYDYVGIKKASTKS